MKIDLVLAAKVNEAQDALEADLKVVETEAQRAAFIAGDEVRKRLLAEAKERYHTRLDGLGHVPAGLRHAADDITASRKERGHNIVKCVTLHLDQISWVTSVSAARCGGNFSRALRLVVDEAMKAQGHLAQVPTKPVPNVPRRPPEFFAAAQAGQAKKVARAAKRAVKRGAK